MNAPSQILGLDGLPVRRGASLNKYVDSGLGNGAANLDSASMQGWNWWGGSADDDIVEYLPTVRQRCRDLALNAPLVAGLLNTLVTNVVGAGLIPEPTPDTEILGMSAEDATKWKRDVLRLWEDFAESKAVDICGKSNFYELQQLIFRSELESGDVFVSLPYSDRRGSLLDLRVQTIEADCVCDPSSAPRMDIEGDVCGGVEVNEFGTVTAYWVATRHPLARRQPFISGRLHPHQREWVRVPAIGEESGKPNLLHVMRSQRPGQRRGIPVLAPVVESMKILDRYCRAELTSALTQTLFTAAIKTQNPAASVGQYDAQSMELMSEGYATGREKFYAENGGFAMGPGTVGFLAPGDEIQPIGVTHPESGFGAFVEAEIKMISGALGIPYEMAVMYFQSSFSASRAAINMATSGFEVWRDHLVADLCAPVYEAFFTEAVCAGLIRAPGFFADRRLRRAYCAAQWGGPGDLSIDPEKELSAYEKAIGLGLTTRTKAAIKYDGSDFRQNAAVLHEEQQVFDAAPWDRTPLTASSAEATGGESSGKTGESNNA